MVPFLMLGVYCDLIRKIHGEECIRDFRLEDNDLLTI
jgi:hypothetical protein